MTPATDPRLATLPDLQSKRSVTWITTCPDSLHWIKRIQGLASEDESGCWIWKGGTGKRQYGHMNVMINGKKCCIGSHRAAWLAFRGDIPEGLVTDHLCRVPLCVNPWHLELVSNAENCRRGQVGRGRRVKQRALKTHCLRGHSRAEHGKQTPGMRLGVMSCRECNRQRTAARCKAPVSS
ncbi:MAG: HNH endonuclease [Propionibacteriales bacterium]|nr:HNH endonuclease [Propionibacteriales bacterium]